MIIAADDNEREIEVSSSDGVFTIYDWSGDWVSVGREQVPALIAALQKFYDGEVI